VQARLGNLTREYRVLRGVELIALGMRNCNGDNPVLIAGRRTRPAAQTQIASARPDAAAPNPFGDLARRVQTAVASALSSPEDQTKASIRIAVPDRERIPDGSLPANAVARLETATLVARVSPALANPPLPPRRPPSEAFTTQDAAPMIPGSQPILSAELIPSPAR
jgi:hypothetical protein